MYVRLFAIKFGVQFFAGVQLVFDQQTKIKISAEIGLSGLIKAGIECIKERVDWGNFKEFNTGNQSAATNTGDWSAAANTGNWSVAIVCGKESIAVATGFDGRAKGSIGCFLVLAEWKEMDGEYHIVDVKSAKVDGDKIKPDTFYSLRDGKLVALEESAECVPCF